MAFGPGSALLSRGRAIGFSLYRRVHRCPAPPGIVRGVWSRLALPANPVTLSSRQHQSDDGTCFGCWVTISLSQHVGTWALALVHSTSVPQTSQRYLFPNWLIYRDLLKQNRAAKRKRFLLFLDFHRLTTADHCTFSRTSNDILGTTFCTYIPFSYLIRHNLSSFSHMD